jgi:acyl carrier protein
MDRKELRALLCKRIEGRSSALGLTNAELTDDLDLLRSGVLDSLSFVDLMAGLMDATGKELDLEKALENRKASTIGGLLDLFA